MQALTLNYLIEGKVKPNGEVRMLMGGGPHYYERRYVLTLTDARVRSTADLNISGWMSDLDSRAPRETWSPWSLTMKTA